LQVTGFGINDVFVKGFLRGFLSLKIRETIFSLFKRLGTKKAFKSPAKILFNAVMDEVHGTATKVSKRFIAEP
jgi:hypothetical protein